MQLFRIGFYKKVFSSILLIYFIFNPILADDLKDIYKQAVKAQENGKYSEFLLNLKLSNNEILVQISIILADLKLKSNESRREASFNHIIHYLSGRHGGFKARALNLLAYSSYSLQDLIAGQYDPQKLASEFLNAVEDYEKNVVQELLFQMEAQMALRYPRSVFMLLGRDFTKGYIYMKSRNIIDGKRILTANVSRQVRDEIFNSGDKVDVEKLLSQHGLDIKTIIDRGVVFVDSSMSGKIPRSIIYALAKDLSDTDRYQFLKKCYFYYFNSSRKVGVHSNEARSQWTFSEQVEHLADGSKSISASQLKKSVEYYSSTVPRFNIILPESHLNWPARHHHNLLEHTFKILQSSTGIKETKKSINIEIPRKLDTAEDRLTTLLGLASEMYLANNARSHKGSVALDYINNGIYFKEAFNVIDEVSKGGRSNMASWQYNNMAEAKEMFERISIVKNSEEASAYSFKIDGKTIVELKQRISEGRNLSVYETMDGMILKVVKDPRQVRKNFMLVWMQKKMQAYNMAYAPVHFLDPSGTWLIQEKVQADTLEFTYYDILNEKGTAGVPRHIRKQVKSEWNKALKLAADYDIWLDFKAANFLLNEQGQLVNVDYVPRLNKGYKFYFYNEDNEELSDKRIFQRFFLHDISKGKLRLKPKIQNCYMAFYY